MQCPIQRFCDVPWTVRCHCHRPVSDKSMKLGPEAQSPAGNPIPVVAPAAPKGLRGPRGWRLLERRRGPARLPWRGLGRRQPLQCNMTARETRLAQFQVLTCQAPHSAPWPNGWMKGAVASRLDGVVRQSRRCPNVFRVSTGWLCSPAKAVEQSTLAIGVYVADVTRRLDVSGMRRLGI